MSALHGKINSASRHLKIRKMPNLKKCPDTSCELEVKSNVTSKGRRAKRNWQPLNLLRAPQPSRRLLFESRQSSELGFMERSKPGIWCKTQGKLSSWQK